MTITAHPTPTTSHHSKRQASPLSAQPIPPVRRTARAVRVLLTGRARGRMALVRPRGARRAADAPGRR